MWRPSAARLISKRKRGNNPYKVRLKGRTDVPLTCDGSSIPYPCQICANLVVPGALHRHMRRGAVSPENHVAKSRFSGPLMLKCVFRGM